MSDYVPTINLSLHTLLRECRSTTRPQEDMFVDISLWNRENIHQIFRYRKFNYDFVDYITCYNDGEHVIGYLKPSYDDFLISITRFLGAYTSSDVVDNEELTEKLLQRVEKLKQIKTTYELKKEFPFLYDDLMQGRKYLDAVEKMAKETEEEQERYEAAKHYYYSCGLRRNVERFVTTQAEVYRRFVTQRKEYKKLIESKSFNRYMKNNFDMDKVAMLAVHTYLCRCEKATDEEEYQKYMSLIEKYLESNYNKDVAVTTKNGFVINKRILEERINLLKRKHAEKEVLAGWELVPEGKELVRVTTDHKPRVLKMTEVDIEALRKAGKRKEAFYQESAYTAKVVGLEKYKGYVGYIYPNGEVLLDREYRDDSPKSDKANAIYNMKVGDFETLSRLDKTTLRDNPRVGRIYHSKHWEDKAKEIVNRVGTLEEQKEVVQLVKRLKEKRI